MTAKKQQLKIGEPMRVPLNLIAHEFYSRFPQAVKGVQGKRADKTYAELRRIQTADGFVEKLVEVDYPITQEYVDSFIDTADYHKDLQSAMATPAPGANLGDLCSLQDLCAMDLTAIRELQNKINVVAAEKAKANPAKEKETEVKVENE